MAFMSRRKICKFCENQVTKIDYKDVRTLRRFVTEQGEIIPRRVTGVCSPHQRMHPRSIKLALNISLIHYTQDVTQP